MDRPTYGRSADDENPASSAETAAQSVCPRHPDRPSYVRCQRCDRPACGECQRSAPVGMLCVDCEAQLRREQASAQPRNAMGGAMAGARTPLVTYTVMGAAILAFVAQTLLPGVPERLGMYVPALSLSRPWTFLTSGFLHGGAMHLVLNMWCLWAIGRYLEQTLGHWRYAAVYLLSVLGGHVAVLLLTSATSHAFYGGTLGASGGIFGLFGALLILHRRMGAQYGQIVVLIVLNLIITFTVPGISWQGHLGGLLVGTVLTAVMFALRPKAAPGADRQQLARRAAVRHAVLAGGMLILLLLAIAVRFLLLGAGI